MNLIFKKSKIRNKIMKVKITNKYTKAELTNAQNKIVKLASRKPKWFLDQNVESIAFYSQISCSTVYRFIKKYYPVGGLTEMKQNLSGHQNIKNTNSITIEIKWR